MHILACNKIAVQASQCLTTPQHHTASWTTQVDRNPIDLRGPSDARVPRPNLEGHGPERLEPSKAAIAANPIYRRLSDHPLIVKTSSMIDDP